MKLHLNDYDFSESFFCFFSPRVSDGFQKTFRNWI
jgi:hypothetical protein